VLIFSTVSLSASLSLTGVFVFLFAAAGFTAGFTLASGGTGNAATGKLAAVDCGARRRGVVKLVIFFFAMFVYR